MANRTIQFFGNGYAPTGTDPITISATLNGNVVYTGTIPTAYTSEIDRLAADQVILFTCELPVTFAGTVPMSISLDSPVGVEAYFSQVVANYSLIPNPMYTESQFSTLANPTTTTAEKIAIYTAVTVTPLSAAEITILETGTDVEIKAVLDAHDLRLLVSSGATSFTSLNNVTDSRTNVVINGEAQTRADTPSGQWGWLVAFPAEESGLFTCDLTIVAGKE